MVAAILSPHLDDAVLSCWHLLEQPGELIVINVFAGVPEDGGRLAWWDQGTVRTIQVNVCVSGSKRIGGHSRLRDASR